MEPDDGLINPATPPFLWEGKRQTRCDLEIRDGNKIHTARCLRTLLRSEETVIKNLVRLKCCHMLRLYSLCDRKGNECIENIIIGRDCT